MKFNTASIPAVLIVYAGLATGINVSPLCPWRSVTNSSLCVQPANTTNGAPLVVRTCDSTNILQQWSFVQDENTIYRLLNAGTDACAWIDDGGPFNGQTVKVVGCIEADGSARPVSNAEWDSGNLLPNVVQLKSHIHFSTTNGCINIVDSNVVIEGCNALSLSQKWIVGF